MLSLPLPWPSDDVISFLVEKSSGQFVFAATVIRFVNEDRKVPSAQLQLVLDIYESLDVSQQKTNPFALLDEIYSHVLRSCDEIDTVLSVLGLFFFLDGRALTPDFLESFVDTNITFLFWGLHSIIHVPASGTDTIMFYHASFGDYLMDHHRSKDFHIDEHPVQSFLLKSCMRQLCKAPDSAFATMSPALEYSRKSWSNHYIRGDSLKMGSLDPILENFKSLFCQSSNLKSKTISLDLLYWGSIYGPVWIKIHHQVGIYFV